MGEGLIQARRCRGGKRWQSAISMNGQRSILWRWPRRCLLWALLPAGSQLLTPCLVMQGRTSTANLIRELNKQTYDTKQAEAEHTSPPEVRTPVTCSVSSHQSAQLVKGLGEFTHVHYKQCSMTRQTCLLRRLISGRQVRRRGEREPSTPTLPRVLPSHDLHTACSSSSSSSICSLPAGCRVTLSSEAEPSLRLGDRFPLLHSQMRRPQYGIQYCNKRQCAAV